MQTDIEHWTPSPLHCRNSITQQHLNDTLRHFYLNKLIII